MWKRRWDKALRFDELVARGLEGLLKMDRTRLCEMIVDYAQDESIHDLEACWNEVNETLAALSWIEAQLRAKREQ